MAVALLAGGCASPNAGLDDGRGEDGVDLEAEAASRCRDSGTSTPAKPDGSVKPDGSTGVDPTPTATSQACNGAAESPSPRLLRLLTRRELQSTLRDLLFMSEREVDVSNVPLEPRVRGFDNNASASVVTSRHIDEFYKLFEALADKAVREKKSQILPCQQGDASCARTFVERFGLRAFRRPLTAEETTRYAGLFSQDLTSGNFDDGMRLAITAMLVSPSFNYRSEVGTQQGGGFKLTQYEIASALSYTYWGTMPDQALFDAAAQNALSTPAQLETQARRLLADNRARAQLAEFSMQWLRSDNVMSAFKDKGVYPSFSDSIRNAMIEEQKRFVTDLVLGQNGKFAELFTANYVVANGELARFYGLNAQNADYGRVSVTPESDRGGLLGLGAVLAAHAHSMESSPIKRGLFVRDRLLCQDLPPPPPSLNTTPPGLDPKLTTRERFAKHTNDAACKGCHQFIDGVGFGFEGFDGVGQKRTIENNLPVDTSGSVLGLESLSAQDSRAFKGQRELGAMLAKSPNAQNCLPLQYYRFARGYQETKQDACSIAKLQQGFQSSGLTVKELLVQLALLESFTNRRAQ